MHWCRRCRSPDAPIPRAPPIEAGDVGRTIETAQGSVVSSRAVEISGDTNAVGPLAGGAAGAAGSALAFSGGSNTGLIAVLGGLIGAGIGYLSQQQLNNREGIEYVLEMDDGRTVTLVQNRADDEVPLADGTPVLVQVSGQYTRVIADPRAERMAGARLGRSRHGGESRHRGSTRHGGKQESLSGGGSPTGATGDPHRFTEPPAVSEQQ